jgi:hypothetical protein
MMGKGKPFTFGDLRAGRKKGSRDKLGRDFFQALSEDFAVAALERESARRREAKWKAGEWTIPVRIVDPGTIGLKIAQPQPPEFVPECLEIHIVDPAPVVETHPYAPDHAAAVDVTPHRPPPSNARSLPPPPGSVDPRNVNVPPSIYSAEQRRTRNFNDDTWGDPAGWPIRYPRGNRSGW